MPQLFRRGRRTVALAAIFFTSVAGSVRAAGPAAIAGRKIAYLTFDADMTSAMRQRLWRHEVARWYDPAIMSYLADHRLPATFFITGMFAELYPALVRQLAANGRYAIGNHTYDHAAFTDRCYGLPHLISASAKRQEIFKTQSILKRLTGRTPALFRFPGLCHRPADLRLVTDLGLTAVDGDVVSGDAFRPDPNRIARTVVSRTKTGSVIVMHLGGPNAPATAQALRRIVPALERLGFTFGRLQ